MVSRCRRAAIAVLLVAFVAATSAARAEESKPPPGPVVAVVNGAEIHQFEVMQAYEVLPDRYRALPVATLFPMLLNSLIDSKLAAAAARDQGLHDDPEVKQVLLRAENRVLEQAYFDRAFADRIGDDAVKKRYDEMAKTNQDEDEVRARHVLVATEAQALQIVAELDGGADFATIAERSSTGPSAAQGGDLGYFARGQMVPAFANAAFALKAGEYTKAPVQTQYGWHVILAVDRRQAALASFEELAETLRGELRQEVGRAIVDDLRRGADITRFNIDGSPVEPAPKKE